MILTGRLGHITGLYKQYRDKDYKAADAVLHQMGIDHLRDRRIQDLSGGERQRAIIARALATEPRNLILDEPTIYVDTPTESRFYEILDDLKKHMTILLVTHDIGVLSDHVTKVACLNQQLFTHDNSEITDDMLTSAYRCPVELIAHGLPHRVLKKHDRSDSEGGNSSND